MTKLDKFSTFRNNRSLKKIMRIGPKTRKEAGVMKGITIEMKREIATKGEIKDSQTRGMKGIMRRASILIWMWIALEREQGTSQCLGN
jgi:hypothetical protein